MIEAVQIATNRYAPNGAQAINMYSMDGGDDLTLGQLIAAVCIKAGANMEAQSITRMNAMNGNTEIINTASGYVSELANGNSSNWPTIRNYMINTMGISASDIPSATMPDNGLSYNDRMKAINAMKIKLEALTRQAQEDMIELQSLINKRDVAYTTSTNLMRELGTSNNNIAQVL